MIYNQLRPINLSDFRGKKEILDSLKVYIAASKKRKTSIDHCLFYGLPGTGKTSLAFAMANELDVQIRIVQGPSIEKPIDIINLLLSLGENDILFIDEIHSVDQQCLELLYSAMEDFAIDITIGKEFNAKVTRIKIPNFTLIGSTTMLYKIPSPLEERFGIIFHFGEYSIEELENICCRNSKILNLQLKKAEINLIAKNSKGIPRNLNRIIKRVLDYRTINPNIEILEILKSIGIVKDGLNEIDIKYLKKLNESTMFIGIKTICQYMNFDEQTIETKIEPFLITNKLIEKTPKGRKITNLGIKLLNSI